MHRYLVSAAIFLLSALAQTYNPGCSETLTFSPGAFTDLYVVLNNNESELGYDMAAQHWANCKHQDNLKRLEQYPNLKTRLEQLGKLYLDLRAAETAIALEYYGGGTLYSHTLARTTPSVEEHISDLIGLTTRTLGAAQASGFADSYDYAIRQLEERVKALRGLTDLQLGQTNRSKWNAAIAKYQGVYQSILKIAGSRKDATSASILAFVNKPLWLEEILDENK